MTQLERLELKTPRDRHSDRTKATRPNKADKLSWNLIRVNRYEPVACHRTTRTVLTRSGISDNLSFFEQDFEFMVELIQTVQTCV